MFDNDTALEVIRALSCARLLLCSESETDGLGEGQFALLQQLLLIPDNISLSSQVLALMWQVEAGWAHCPIYHSLLLVCEGET